MKSLKNKIRRIFNLENLFDTGEMEALLNQLNSTKLEKASDEVSTDFMTKEMEASQRRYEEIIKKHENDND